MRDARQHLVERYGPQVRKIEFCNEAEIFDRLHTEPQQHPEKGGRIQRQMMRPSDRQSTKEHAR